jgi:S1-C subfamily serine protease
MAYIGTLLLVFLVTGCATKVWYKPGVTELAYKQDRFQCMATTGHTEQNPMEAFGQAMQSTGAAMQGGYNPYSTQIQNQSARRQMFNACMEANGYQLVSKDEVTAPGNETIKQAQKFGDKVAAGAQRSIVVIKTRFPERPYCDEGTLWLRSGVIHTVLPKATAAGLRPGDRVVAVNGVRVFNAEEGTREIIINPPGATLILTVDRNGDERDISARCDDGSRFRTATLRILEATANKDWKACREAIQDFVRMVGTTPAYILDSWLQCTEAERVAASRPFDLNDAQLRYEANRKRIEEARYDPLILAEIRGRVLAEAELLQRLGYQAFAQDIRAELDKPLTQEAEASPLPPTRKTKSQGTCFAVTPDGGVLTAYHIVENGKEIWVTFANGQRERASVEQLAMTVDIAFLRVNRKAEFYLPLASTHTATVGQRVFTIGFPATAMLGFEPKFTDGSISALSGPGGEASFMQVTVPIQPGNSGGPLMNDRGEVLGIITSTAAIGPFLASTGSLPQSVNWAVKADYAMPLVASQNIQVAPTREEAIKRGMSAVCLVEANQR